MRPSRRTLLFGLGGGGLALIAGHHALARARRGRPGIRDITVKAAPVAAFDISHPDLRLFGPLEFIGGLALSSDDPDFGGFSSIRMLSADGRFLALSDRAYWLEGQLRHEAGRPAAVTGARIAPALDEHGRPLANGPAYDTESLVVHEGVAHVGIERVNEVRRFEWARDGLRARGVPIPLPAEARRLPDNRGFESLGVMPSGSHAPGSLIAISERSAGKDDPTVGFLIGGRQRGRFQVRRHDRFDITALDFLPSGDMVLLERRFSWLRGIAMRLRRIPGKAIADGAMLDGEILLTADSGYAIDNMEGLSITRDEQGRLVFTLISDDNFSFLQRTLLLQFELPGEA